MRFADRADAGRGLGARLRALGPDSAVVLGLPRGGVAVAAQVARVLDCPLDVLVVRKLGVPWRPELAMGAIGEGGGRFVERDVVDRGRVSPGHFARVEQAEAVELARRVALYRSRWPREELAGRTAIVVDDGVATGATARVACALVAREAARVVLAVPVLPSDLINPLREVVDELVWLAAPEQLGAVGAWYQDFTQLTDRDVIALLDEARRRGSEQRQA